MGTLIRETDGGLRPIVARVHELRRGAGGIRFRS